MDFTFSDDQNAIKELAYKIFTDRATDEFLLEFSRRDDLYDNELWQTLADQGLLGITLPESANGSGLGFTELCLILEEQGRRVAPVPLYSTLVLGALPLLEFGSDAQQQQWLKPVASGEARLSAAIAERGMHAAVATQLSATKTAKGWSLNGARTCVQDGATAQAILVPAIDNDGNTSVFIVDTSVSGLKITAQQIGLLGETNADLQFSDVDLGNDALLGEAGNGDVIMAWLEQHADTAHAALQVGICGEALQRTADFTGERKQFGVPIGTFQALAMRMADGYIDVEAMRSTYWLALNKLVEGKDARLETAAAKWWACEGAHRVIHTAQHLHGGMGNDIEYPLHRFFLWAKQISYATGGGSHQLGKLGKLLAADDSIGAVALQA